MGPNVQIPTSYHSLVGEDGVLRPEWAAFMNALQQIAFGGTRAGTTLERPTSLVKGRWIGMPYFDTDLAAGQGMPIWLASVAPDVWVDATGTPA